MIINRKSLLCLFTALLFCLTCGCKKADTSGSEISSTGSVTVGTEPEADDTADPENSEFKGETGVQISAEELTAKAGKANGIDVSKWQGKINWSRVAACGIDFAMIRIGFRGENGVIYRDTCADYNIQQAEKVGIAVGVYFFSTAVNTEEARKEAEWTAAAIAGYSVSYPVVYDCEGFLNAGSRMYGISSTQRTDNALAFLNAIKAAGYDGMLYSAVSELQASRHWETERIEKEFSVWVARYPDVPYPKTEQPGYSGRYDMWQYTDNGRVSGIDGNVDLSVSYLYPTLKKPKNSSARPATAEAPSENGDAYYTALEDEVTPKIEVNLRTAATTKSSIAATVKNGTVLQRKGIGTNGWSRLIYNGKTVYAITSYLTTDISYRPPTASADDGFTTATGQVTAKEETNLRAAPTTESEIVGVIKNGDFVKKTGESAAGWTRLEYNGKTVYAKSSLLTTEVKQNSEAASSADDGFTAASGSFTAKDEVNLRSAPNGKEDNVVCTLKRGDFAERLGTNGGKGWTKLFYNGQTLYAVSSMLLSEEEFRSAEQ